MSDGSESQSSSRLRRIAYTIGTLIFLASIAYLALFVHRNWPEVRAVDVRQPNLILLSAAIYAICHVSSGLSWPLAVRALGTQISLRDGIVIGLVAQIGKYLPGNIAHYFGRATIAADAGVPIKVSGISTVIEILSAVLAATFVAGAAMLVDPSTYSYIALQLNQASHATVLTLAGLVTVAAAVAIYMRRNAIPFGAVLGPTTCLSIGFFLSGLSFAALTWAIGIGSLSFASIVTIFAVAWIAGFLIPGSPAGLGVREAVLVGFIAPQAGPGAAIACAILHRVLTAIVDLLAASVGYAAWIRSKKKKSANDVLSGSATSHG